MNRLSVKGPPSDSHYKVLVTEPEEMFEDDSMIYKYLPSVPGFGFEKIIKDFDDKRGSFYPGNDKETDEKAALATSWIFAFCSEAVVPYQKIVINKNYACSYHGQHGGEGYQAVFVFRKNCIGGHLVFPELDKAFEMPNGSAIIVKNVGLLHGVTDFEISGSDSYRNSVLISSV